MKFVGEWRDDETKRVTRAVLWKAYMDLNEAKVQANMARLKISPTRWEREYGEFLRSTWEQESKGGGRILGESFKRGASLTGPQGALGSFRRSTTERIV